MGNCGRAGRRQRQNLRGRHILSSRRCLPNQAETGECVWQVQSERLEASRCLPTCTHKSSGTSPLSISRTHRRRLHERLTLPCTITVGYKVRCLVQPLFYIGLLGATGCSDGASLPMHVCASKHAREHERICCSAGMRGAQEFIRLQLRRAAAGSCAVAKCCQEAELRVRWGGLLLMSVACLLTD